MKFSPIWQRLSDAERATILRASKGGLAPANLTTPWQQLYVTAQAVSVMVPKDKALAAAVAARVDAAKRLIEADGAVCSMLLTRLEGDIRHATAATAATLPAPVPAPHSPLPENAEKPSGADTLLGKWSNNALVVHVWSHFMGEAIMGVIAVSHTHRSFWSLDELHCAAPTNDFARFALELIEPLRLANRKPTP